MSLDGIFTDAMDRRLKTPSGSPSKALIPRQILSSSLFPDLHLHGQPSSSLRITSTGLQDAMTAWPLDRRRVSLQIPVASVMWGEGGRPDSGKGLLPGPSLPHSCPGNSQANPVSAAGLHSSHENRGYRTLRGSDSKTRIWGDPLLR